MAEGLEEGDGQFADVLVMGLNIEMRVDDLNGLLSNQSLRLPFMLSLEQELPIQIGNLHP